MAATGPCGTHHGRSPAVPRAGPSGPAREGTGRVGPSPGRPPGASSPSGGPGRRDRVVPNVGDGTHSLYPSYGPHLDGHGRIASSRSIGTEETPAWRSAVANGVTPPG